MLTIRTATPPLMVRGRAISSCNMIHFVNSYVFPAGCDTIGGPDAGKPCVFPFKINNVTYRGCTTEGPDDDDTPRCSTLVDDEGNHKKGHWGHCGDGCPLHDTDRGRKQIQVRGQAERNDPVILSYQEKRLKKYGWILNIE